MEKERIVWLDIAKLLGILAIFCGHLGPETGNLRGFVFLYHVPLFFFISGIFAVRLEQMSFKEAVRKRFEQIIIPYSFLVIITMVMIIVVQENDFIMYLKYLKQFIWGIRNQMYASSLWFFSCLFCVSVLFEVLRRLLKSNVLVLTAAICVYVLSVTLFPNRPDQQPSMFFNIDSACFYLIYYALGFFYGRQLQKAVCGTQWEGRKKVVSLAGIVVLSCYVVLVYIGEDIDIFAKLTYHQFPVLNEIYYIVRTLLLIIFNLALAGLLAGFGKLADIGTQTLWLCGNEFIVKQIFNAAASIFGFQITISSALAAVIYAVAMTVFIMKVLVPIEMKLYRKYKDCIRQICPALFVKV